MALILVCGAGLFFVMPRMSAGYLGGYSFGTDFSSGFSDHVQLGEIGQIQQSNSIVMHVQIDGDSTGRYDLHWRGVALADFDGHAWSNSREQSLLRRASDDTFVVPRGLSGSADNLGRENVIHYRVLMEPVGTNVFFLAPWVRSVSGNYRSVAIDPGGALYDFDSRHAISRYEATSNIATALPDELRLAAGNYPTSLGKSYLHFPELDPRVPQLAVQITGSANNNYDKAAAIEHYLRTRFGYTLELPQTSPKDPIANFLFERKQGHCEYFASSMAVMLRTLGIPSRVVTGFRSDEFNDLTGSYVIRAKDAHAWVEAYFPGYGWQTFDPTPAGNGTGTPQGWGRLSLYVDAMASFWREWVVSYDFSHQYVLGQAAATGSRNLWERARQWARNRYESMLKWAQRGQDRIERSPGSWALIGAAIALALLVLANLNRILRLSYQRWLEAHPERSPEQAAAMWYGRMARVLAGRGMRKAAAQTAQEFARRIEDERLREPVMRFTAAYESARFGNSGSEAQRLPELLEEIELATRDG
jgi:transglutaminase-like putative cysteine protease